MSQAVFEEYVKKALEKPVSKKTEDKIAIMATTTVLITSILESLAKLKTA
jgi:hypothetical protein